MPPAAENLWDLAFTGQPIDASALAAALERQAGARELDFRTRLLIRDALNALAKYWGPERADAWLAESSARETLQRVRQEDLGEPGFPSLSHRIMDATTPELVFRFLRELGSRLNGPARLEIGGAISLILAGALSRSTEDIDIVDEVPADVRGQHELLRELAGRYGLHLAHFQSHYLPTAWRSRLHSAGRFGQLDVMLVDACDVLVGKLFSARAKDRDDLRALTSRFDKPTIEARLRDAAGPLLADPRLAAHAVENWYILYGEALPVTA
jgi:hypothetical protein